MASSTHSTITEIIDDCLAQIERGVSLDDCLAQYPDNAAELKYLLDAILVVQRVGFPELSDARYNAIHRQARRAFVERTQRRPFWFQLRGWRAVALRFATGMFVVALSSGGVVAAAQQSVPGDLLYPVKRNSEQARIQLTGDAVTRARLYLEFSVRRAEEVKQLAQDKRPLSTEALADIQENYDASLGAFEQLPPDKAERYGREFTQLTERANALLLATVPLAPQADQQQLLNQTIDAGESTADRFGDAQDTPVPTPQSRNETVGTPTMQPNATATPTRTPEVVVVGQPPAPTVQSPTQSAQQPLIIPTATVVERPRTSVTVQPTAPRPSAPVVRPTDAPVVPTAPQPDVIFPPAPPHVAPDSTPTPMIVPTNPPAPTATPVVVFVPTVRSIVKPTNPPPAPIVRPTNPPPTAIPPTSTPVVINIPTSIPPTSVPPTQIPPTAAPPPSVTPNGPPDLVVSDITWNPANPAVGQPVTFSATVTNRGAGPSPEGAVKGVAFSVAGKVVTWSDNATAAIPVGGSIIVTANGGPNGSSVWIATPGEHTIEAWVDDINRIAEQDESNNELTKPLISAAPPLREGDPLDKTGWIASASSEPWPGSEPVERAIDGDTDNRYSGGIQQEGMWFQVDLGQSQTFSKLVVDSGDSEGDYARGYSVYVSDTGADWNRQAPIAAGPGEQVTTITFAPRTARFIRVVLHAPRPEYWWSIHEFTVYR